MNTFVEMDMLQSVTHTVSNTKQIAASRKHEQKKYRAETFLGII